MFLVQAEPVLPAVRAGIQNDSIGKGVRVAGGDRRNVIFIPIDDGEDLQRRLLEHVLHRLADFGAFWAGIISLYSLFL